MPGESTAQIQFLSTSDRHDVQIQPAISLECSEPQVNLQARFQQDLGKCTKSFALMPNYLSLVLFSNEYEKFSFGSLPCLTEKISMWDFFFFFF